MRAASVGLVEPDGGAGPPRARATVFVLDDDLAVQQGLRSLLLTYELDVRVFGTAEEFLGTVEPSSDALLLCEVDLPGMGGIALLGAMRERSLRLPVIMMAKRGSVADAVGAMRAGAVDFLEKPFLQDHLVDRIMETLHHGAEGAATTATQAAAPRTGD